MQPAHRDPDRSRHRLLLGGVGDLDEHQPPRVRSGCADDAGDRGERRLVADEQDLRGRPTAWGPLRHERVPLFQDAVTEELGLWLTEHDHGLSGAVTYDVDVFDRGIGFFFRLWNIKVGERVVLSAGDVHQAYKITTVRQVPRTDLVDDAQVFDIAGPPRLVLITCAGEFRPDSGGYSRNLIVVARPVS